MQQTRHTAATAPAVTGERTIHHVHETVQPVIYHQKHQTEVVHIVQPIHEKHHAPSEIHGVSMLPKADISELQERGIDVLQDTAGVAHKRQEYNGVPKPYDPNFQLTRNPVDLEPHKHLGLHDMEATGHPYESRFENEMAVPMTGSHRHSGVEQPRTPTKARFRDSGIGSPVSPVGSELDPRSHWGSNSPPVGLPAELPDRTTSLEQKRSRPHSGIAIPDRGASRGKVAGMDSPVSPASPTGQKMANADTLGGTRYEDQRRREVSPLDGVQRRVEQRRDTPVTTTTVNTPSTTTTTTTTTSTTMSTGRR